MPRKRSAITLSISAHEKAQLEQLALEFGQTWGENANVSKLIKAIAQNKLSRAINHAKTFLNNMLRNGDWGNLALRCEEALALRARSAETAVAKVGERQRSPFEKTEEERRASALGLARFKVAQGEISRGREISRQFGFSMVEIGLGADATVGHTCRSQAA